VSTSDRAGARHLGLLWGGVALALVALAPLAPRISERLPVCYVKQVSGIPCPGCGSGRAALALARFDPLAASAASPLATAAWIVLVLGGLTVGALAAGGVALREPTWQLPTSVRFLIVGLILANWAYLVGAGI
jgi:hypothetical protein